MKFWVGVTDNQWFKYLSDLQPDEVNFWQPSATPPFTAAPVGMPFLFKLKRPNNHIAGGGYFVTYSKLSLSHAWEIFGQKNGCNSVDELRKLINPLTATSRDSGEIGCTVLANPFFFEKSLWLADPPGWAPAIVRGKMYETTEYAGQKIWHDIQLRMSAPVDSAVADGLGVGITAEPGERYGAPVTVRPRIGQSSFRLLVTEAYQRRCAITGEKTLVALEAAELLDHFRWARDSDLESVTMKHKDEIESELADVTILLSYICHDLGLSIEKAVMKKLEINRANYPVEKSKGISTKHDRL